MRYLFLFFVLVCSLFFSFNKLFAQAPTITSFSPTSGTIGTLVTILGTNLNNIDTVKIGGVAAIKITSTDTNLVAMVMPNAITGDIYISNNIASATSNSNFINVNSISSKSQQGNKLVGTGNIGQAHQGYSVSISADGNTAVVGGYLDNFDEVANVGAGAVWIYTRIGSIWIQQGNKIAGTAKSSLGCSVSISADGNTVIVGGYTDNIYLGIGAAWILTRTGGIWTQQGNKLVGTGYQGTGLQGYSVSISADGNTAIIGGHTDNNNQGAAWIFNRSGTTWTQQGNKLVGTGNVGMANQGTSVSISADGNTAIVGGEADNSNQGAAWIFTRSGNTWTQQGNKLVGTGNVGMANQGTSVSISADGNTAIVGGDADNSNQGAAWIFTRNGTTWTQQGNKLTGTGNIGTAFKGTSVSISADGNKAIVGGVCDNSYVGAAWFFIRTGNTWTQQGNKLVGTGRVGQSFQGNSVSISADGNTAIVGGHSDNNVQGASWIYSNLKIKIIGSLSKFEKCLGFNSNAQSISIFGIDILSNITVAAPTGFEISRDTSINYSSSVVLTPLNGVIDTTIIYIRLTTLASGDISGNIIFTNNESTMNIPVFGTTDKIIKPYIKDFKLNQCLKNNFYLFTDSTIYRCGYINRKWFLNNILYSTDSSFQYSFTNAGTYYIKLIVTNINGEKDSVTKRIIVYPNPNLSIIASQNSTCKGQGQSVKLTGSGALNYTWTNGVVNDVFFVPDTTKNYQVIASDINGCFDTANITIEVKPMPIVITTLDKNKITTYQFGASFQWYDCDTKLPIVNATNQIYTATKNGNYAVIVNLNNCIDTSDCVAVLSLSQQEINKESDFNIYPNPNNGSFIIKLSNTSSTENKITIIDMLGRIVYQSENIIKQNTDNIIIPPLNLVNGLYTLILNSNGETAFRKSLTIQNTN